MAPGVREAERFEKCAERLFAVAIDGELDERDAIQPRRFGQIEQRDLLQGLRGAGLRVRRCLARKALARLRFEIEQRLHRVDGSAAIGCFAEHVVEDFERQRSRIAGDENVFEDADIQMAGYAAALRVLTRYAVIDGRDMTAEERAFFGMNGTPAHSGEESQGLDEDENSR